MKKCFKCGVEKPLTEYYKHREMADGHLNKCKDCTRADTKSNTDKKMSDPVWAEDEKTRHRRKYHRLGYKEKHKPTPEEKKLIMARYKQRYPEKYAAKMCAQRLEPLFESAEAHHWSYNEDDYTDVIWLIGKDHMKAHRFLIYDQERRMYRRYDTNELLDTKEKHEKFIRWCIEVKED